MLDLSAGAGGGALSTRDSVAGSLKHMAMSQLLEALQVRMCVCVCM